MSLAWKRSGRTDGLQRCPFRVEVSGPPFDIDYPSWPAIFFFCYLDPIRTMVLNLCDAVTL